MGSVHENWHVYIIECNDKELYVGIAKDVQKRTQLHNKGSACRYTKYRNPVKLVFAEKLGSYSLARGREKEIKGFTRKKKLALINRDPSAALRLQDLNNFAEVLTPS